jgi:hypothetical protein
MMEDPCKQDRFQPSYTKGLAPSSEALADSRLNFAHRFFVISQHPPFVISQRSGEICGCCGIYIIPETATGRATSGPIRVTRYPAKIPHPAISSSCTGLRSWLKAQTFKQA